MVEPSPEDLARTKTGFLPVAEMTSLSDSGVVLLDRSSTLVSPGVSLASGVILWPGVILQTAEGGTIIVGEAVHLYPGTRIVAVGGRISIGKGTEIGEEGGFTIKAEGTDCVIRIGDGARLLGGGSLSLDNTIGDGAQVLGPIRMQNCRLAGGGSYREPDPDRRGAVLKGCGVARRIELPAGRVIQAFGVFSDAPVRQQSYFHPTPQV